MGGLTPERDQSGERDIVGRIIKAVDAGLRAALYQAATVMLDCAGPSWLKAWALRLARLHGKKRATVALARRIGVVLHRMCRDGRTLNIMLDGKRPITEGGCEGTFADAAHSQGGRGSARRRPTGGSRRIWNERRREFTRFHQFIQVDS